MLVSEEFSGLKYLPIRRNHCEEEPLQSIPQALDTDWNPYILVIHPLQNRGAENRPHQNPTRAHNQGL